MSDIVIAEVYAGLLPKDRNNVQKLFSACYFLPTSREDAQWVETWPCAYARQRMILSTTDTLIAATAYAHRATIVTANMDDYPMDDVPVLPLPRVMQ